jgi:hypothetical protein
LKKEFCRGLFCLINPVPRVAWRIRRVMTAQRSRFPGSRAPTPGTYFCLELCLGGCLHRLPILMLASLDQPVPISSHSYGAQVAPEAVWRPTNIESPPPRVRNETSVVPTQTGQRQAPQADFVIDYHLGYYNHDHRQRNSQQMHGLESRLRPVGS